MAISYQAIMIVHDLLYLMRSEGIQIANKLSLPDDLDNRKAISNNALRIMEYAARISFYFDPPLDPNSGNGQSVQLTASPITDKITQKRGK